MDSAKQAVNKFIGRSGQHDTEVDERVNPAVTQETVKPHRHEETVKAVDREVHQDHYHTTVQPLQHKEVLPERHSHQQMPVEEREIHHGDSSNIKSSVEREAAQFANTSTVHPTRHTTSQGAAVAGEHVHHHVHETVQPVVHKEVVQPEVVHTTVPVHETHHAQAEHHGISTLPTKTLSEFQSAGGKATGESRRHEEYEGHPRPYNPSLQQGARSEADVNPAGHDGIHGSHSTSGHDGHGHHGQHQESGVAGTQGLQSGTTGSHGLGSGTTGGLTGTSGSHVSGDRDISDRSSGYGSTGHVGSTGTALGGRTEGNTASRALGAAAGHDSTTTGSTHTGTHGVGSESTTGRGLEHSSTGHSTTSGAGQHQNQHADTSSSTNRDSHSATGTSSDHQNSSQGRDPNLVEANKSANWKGDGAPGSHSAVFGLTPDGKQHNETSHGTTPLKSKDSGNDNAATGDTGSRASTGGRVADQMNDPRVAEKGHGGGMTSTGNEKPGAGAPGGEQGFGQIRSDQHGPTSKAHDKLDPNTDADGDGKRGVMD